MELKAFDILLCRTPVFSVEDDLDEKWDELKTMIRDSSPPLFEIIKDLDYRQLKSAGKKINYSIWKYFNRARFRATPYGRFAAFSTVHLKNGECPSLVLKHKLNTLDLIDWGAKDCQINGFRKVLKYAEWFQINSSIYRVRSELRFIRFKNDCFEIGSVTTFPELDTILEHCIKRIQKRDLYRVMKSGHELNIKDVDILLEQMLTLQLILCDRLPNITGEDYFKRLSVKKETTHINYTIAERKVESGGFDLNRVRNIPNLIRFLQANLPPAENGVLSDFKHAFLKKFEQSAIPLLIAMDPELGVGYKNLAHSVEDLDLIEVVNKSKRLPESNDAISYTKLHNFLLNAMLSGTEIKLDNFTNQRDIDHLPLPNSLSVMLRLYNEQPVIESIGGCTANALTGRFTMASDELTLSGQHISSSESDANPDLIFFDIAYQAEKEVDNVNRRKQLYPYELPILTWSCHQATLCLDDILVAIRNSEIILWSKKYDKRLIPRIPSAYNYGRSDLSVYRFLCDLQHQGIKSDLSFNFQHFFPNLVHYPRVTYKNIIVSPAMWLIPENIKKLWNSDDTKNSILQLKSWFQNQAINFYVKSGISDQKLCFNPNEDSDLIALLSYFRQNQSGDIYISEALFTEKSEVSDIKGKPYIAEYILNYGHSDRVYKGNYLIIEKTRTLPSNILPGGDWLYFEIYCHPSRSNEILLNQIDEFIKDSQEQISKWFFIRYDDPKPHLRLRIQLVDSSFGYQIIKNLNSVLETDFHTGLISDIQIKTYYREIERYGADRIKFVEEFFFLDSLNVKLLLANRHTTIQLYSTALNLFQNLFKLCFNSIDVEIDFATNMADAFKNEFNLDHQSLKKINQSFQDHKLALSDTGGKSLSDLSSSYTKVLLNILNDCDSEHQRTKIIADLLHMHINRLFDSHQRSHEAIIYQYLVKLLKAKQAALANLQEFPAER
ncbi:MAG: thiopeptide-type bacteriocin biosynthesis protein [Bacteroidota bacterium]